MNEDRECLLLRNIMGTGLESSVEPKIFSGAACLSCLSQAITYLGLESIQ